MKFRVKQVEEDEFYPQVKFSFWQRWRYIVAYGNEGETCLEQPLVSRERLDFALEAIEDYKEFIKKLGFFITIYHKVD